MPAILTPAHPSYPSNHSFQSHLIAHILGSLFEGYVADTMKAQLFALAARVSKNREIAGVHFSSDTRAGMDLAEQTFALLDEMPGFREIRNAAKEEGWAILGVGPRPFGAGGNASSESGV